LNGEAEHEPEKNRTKRKIAKCAFWILVVMGATVILAGLASDAVAARIDKIGFFLGAWFSVLGGVVLGYFGVSTWGYTAQVRSGRDGAKAPWAADVKGGGQNVGR